MMGTLSAKLRSVMTTSGAGIGFWCPGCKEMHVVGAEKWNWNKDVLAPTLTPSILVTGVERITDDEYARIIAGEKIVTRPLRCHSFLRAGVIEFLSDCTHALAAHKVPLPDFPADMDRW